MIAICDPQCKNISHLKVNSGFIYGLSLAYPKEKIVFFAETSHFNEVKELFKNNNIKIKNLTHFPINFNSNKSYSLEGIVQYYFLFKKIFIQTLSHKANKIFFLSTGPIILLTIKKLKFQKRFKNINFSFVLHGELEDIANHKYQKPYVPSIPNNSRSTNLYERIINFLATFKNSPSYLLDILFSPLRYIYSQYTLIFKRKFRMKKMMMWRHSNHFKYISLSPHVTKNAQKHLDTKFLNFHTIYLPIIFKKSVPNPKNKYIKFAVFGYGDSSQMNKMLKLLSKRKISKPYEIRIISMDIRGTKGFSNVRSIGTGKVLTRQEMEVATKDIDIFINLYKKDFHSLGCSLSIFEALSHQKPVLHLSNPGYNYFNKPNKPIGYKTETLTEFVDKMCDMIENYRDYKKELSFFRKNITEYQQQYSIDNPNNLLKLKKSLKFEL
jgi:hypothetical protein